MAAGYGFDITGPAAHGEGSGAVVVFRISRRREGTERRGDVARPHLHLSRYLLRTRSRRRDARRGAGAGDHRRLRDQAAHRPVPADTRVRRTVRRRPDVGDRVDRRNGRRRSLARHEDQFPPAADALQSRPRARAEPHDLVLAADARRLPPVRLEGRHRHELDPVRERRDHAPRLGRRRRDRLLRVADGRRQADAVLRRSGEPRQMPPLRHQRRPRRGERRAGRAAGRPGDRATSSTSTTSSRASSRRWTGSRGCTWMP